MYGRKKNRYLKKYRLSLALAGVLAIAGTGFTVVGPRILGNATTELFRGIMAKLNGTGGMDFEAIAAILLRFLHVCLAGAFFTFLSGWMMAGITARFICELRSRASEKLHALPIQYYERKTTGEVLSRVTTDIDVLEQSLGQSAGQLFSALTMLVGIVLMMVGISVPLALCAVLILPVSAVVLRVLAKKSRIYFEKQQEILGEVHAGVEEAYSGYKTIRAFGRKAAVAAAFGRENETLYEAAWRAEFYAGMMMLLTQLVGSCGYVLTALLGGWFAVSGNLQVGDIQAFIHYIRNISQPVQQISQAAGMLQTAAASWGRIRAFLEEPEAAETQAEQRRDGEDGPWRETAGDAARTNRTDGAASEKKDGQTAHSKEEERRRMAEGGSVRFEHVSFGYALGQPVLQDFSAEIRPGQRVAVIGQTGIGKTTLMKLLLRFYDVTEGAVYVDGKNVRAYDRKELRRRFAVVSQDIWLFCGTILENIRYGRPEAAREEVQNAAVMASADAFIRKLPQGYDTVIDGEGSGLSQGQKQLLTIARAFLVNPEILIFDEATSSVDTRTEQQIHLAMETLMQGKTCFIIAHRPSTIRGADLVWRIGGEQKENNRG